jgi:hypothetical protein
MPKLFSRLISKVPDILNHVRYFNKKTHMNQLMNLSTIREMIDIDFVNHLMIDIIRKQLGISKTCNAL